MVREERRRYIALLLEGKGISEKELIDYLKNFHGEKGLWLIYYDGKRALVRASHRDKEDAVNYLNTTIKVEGGEVHIKTIGVSGTIKRARKKYLDGVVIPRRRRGSSAGKRRRVR
ncbi:hypothetical protein DRJ54_04480 [Candidatus Acetothermia bacterium]|nr:MAG: hypothetical protein DRJ54_04480 [Candidatus Acetothermia bacterium]